MKPAFPQLILASKSPRRQFLLKEAGFDFSIRTLDTDESFPGSLEPVEVAPFLARKKAEAFDISGNEILVTADTTVCLPDLVLNKPTDISEAKAMLMALSGRDHEVVTGVCLRSLFKTQVFAEKTKVYFKTLEEEEIDHYIRIQPPFDKAGGYGIQEWIGYIGIERIEGCYYNVMGFPVARFYQELKRFISPLG